MNNSEPNINVGAVVRTIKENFKALREGFDPSKLTKEEINKISKDFERLEAMALKLKADLAKD